MFAQKTLQFIGREPVTNNIQIKIHLPTVWPELQPTQANDTRATYLQLCISDVTVISRLTALFVKNVFLFLTMCYFNAVWFSLVKIRDVMKFAFEFDDVWTLNFSSRFEIHRIFFHFSLSDSNLRPTRPSPRLYPPATGQVNIQWSAEVKVFVGCVNKS